MGVAVPRAACRYLILLVAAGGLPACWYSAEQGHALEADIVKLKAEYTDQHKELADESARAKSDREKLRAAQDDAIKRMDGKIDELNHAARKTGADLSVDLDRAQKDIDALRGMIEELQARYNASEQSRQDLQKKLADMTAKLQEWEDFKAAEAKKAAARPAGKDAFYDMAKLKLDSGAYADARTMFQEFLQKWGDDPLAANAQYWIGESYYGEGNYKQAGLEFHKVQKDYPKSDKAPDALLKLGYAFLQLSLKDDAKTFLEEVQREYPKSDAAKKAKEKLAELSKRSKG